MNFSGKNVLISGGSSGIGLAIAKLMASKGANTTLLARRKNLLEEAAQQVKEKHILDDQQVSIISSDVSDFDRLQASLKATKTSYDILVNSAGIIKANFITDVPESTWDAIIDVDLKGTFLCIKEVTKYMVEQKGGKIINISSKSGKKGGLWLAAYSSAKFGVIGLTQSVATDLAPFHINVNAICPGNVFSTPMWDLLDKEYSVKLGVPPEQVRKIYVEKVPLGRGCTVEDISNLAVFLASSQSDYMTGQAINLTGGQEVH